MLKLVSSNRSRTLTGPSSPQSMSLHPRETIDEKNEEQQTESSNSDIGKSNNHISHDAQVVDSADTEDNRLNLLVKAAERIGEETHRYDERLLKPTKKNSKAQFSYRQTINLNECVDSKKSNENNELASNDVFFGKNGKPTRPFKAYTRDQPTASIGNNKNDINLASPPISSSSPIPLVNEQQVSSIDIQNQKQNNFLQILTHQLIQQQQSHQTNSEINNITAKPTSQVVINLEDVLNVILNAANIVSSQATPYHPNGISITTQKACLDHQLIPELTSKSNISNEENTTFSSMSSKLSSSDEMQDNFEIDMNGYDDITKISLMNSNDFCTQYKKRIQQAKERIIQKKLQEEQELAKSLESKRTNKKNRKRSQLMSHVEVAEIDCFKNKINNQQNSDSNIDTNVNVNGLIKKLLDNELNSQLFREPMINDLDNLKNSDEQQNKFQLILSALAINDQFKKQPEKISGNPSDMCLNIHSNHIVLNDEEIQSCVSNDETSLLNSYPPKKRHRMHMQQQDKQQKPYDTSLHLSVSSGSSGSSSSGSSGGELFSDLQNLNQNSKEANLDTKNTNQQKNDCSLSSTSGSISMSPSPQPSPSVLIESAPGSYVSSLTIGKNDFNQFQNLKKFQRKSRNRSNNSSNSSSRSSSQNQSAPRNNNSTHQLADNNLKQNASFISSNQPTSLMPHKKDARSSSIDTDNMAESSDKDQAYKERRRKNNEAAKRSRDARRAKEDDIALRAAILERENLQLRVEVSQLKQETNKLRCLLYNS